MFIPSSADETRARTSNMFVLFLDNWACVELIVIRVFEGMKCEEVSGNMASYALNVHDKPTYRTYKFGIARNQLCVEIR